MPRYRCKVDGNHTAIKNALIKTGWCVEDTASVGGGFPDLVIAKHALTILAEIKIPEAKGRANEYTPQQQEFNGRWTGSLITLRTVDDVIELNKCMVGIAGVCQKVANHIKERAA